MRKPFQAKYAESRFKADKNVENVPIDENLKLKLGNIPNHRLVIELEKKVTEI